MSDDSKRPAIPVVCPECDTRTRIPFSDVDEAVDRHNENVHDGEPLATVDPDVFDHLADHVAADLGLLEEP